MQVNDIGLLEFRQSGDISTTLASINIKEMCPIEPQVAPNQETLPQKMPLTALLSGQCTDR